MLALRPEDIDKVAAAGPGASGPGAPAAAAAAPAAVAAPAAAAAAAPAAASAAPAEGRVNASPFAKKLADDLGVDLAFVTGTGPEGRIQAEDVEAAAASGSAPAPAYVSGVVSVMPSARKLAKSKGVKLETVKGTGPYGRITNDDVLIAAGLPPTSKPAPAAAAAAAPAAAAAAPAAKGAPPAAPAGPAPAGTVPMNGMQKAVVKNMNWANSVPTYQVTLITLSP